MAIWIQMLKTACLKDVKNGSLKVSKAELINLMEQANMFACKLNVREAASCNYGYFVISWSDFMITGVP